MIVINLHQAGAMGWGDFARRISFALWIKDSNFFVEEDCIDQHYLY